MAVIPEAEEADPPPDGERLSKLPAPPGAVVRRVEEVLQPPDHPNNNNFQVQTEDEDEGEAAFHLGQEEGHQRSYPPADLPRSNQPQPKWPSRLT